MLVRIILVASLFWLCACSGSDGAGERPGYVILVDITAEREKKASEILGKQDSDTVDADSHIHAFSKGVQKYAHTLMRFHREEKLGSLRSADLQVLDRDGKDIVPTLTQTQRDSVLMEFIQFSRRSNIPYHDIVKDFELKVMEIR